MKKILILSYHFEPMNVIATQRAKGYANHFKKFGFEPTIITHQWDKKYEQQLCSPADILSNTIFEENQAYRVYKLPIGNFKRGRLLGAIEKTFSNKIGILVSWICGHLDTTSKTLNCKLTERHFLKEHLKTHHYDVMMGIFSPHYHLSNCSWAHKKFNTPYVLDFRDFWSNRILEKEYMPTITTKLQDALSHYYWKKWSDKSLFCTITGEYWASKLSDLLKKESFNISNGFENIPFAKQSIISEYFEITSTGTIYPQQDLDLLLKGIKRFIEKCAHPKQVKINFIGLMKKNGTHLPIEEKILAELSAEIVKITPRLPKNEALKYQFGASVLIFPTLPSQIGFHSGKIFEYIASSRPILASPVDNFAVANLLEETQTGICSSLVSEIVDFLEVHYSNWESHQKVNIPIKGNDEKIRFYSRENQTKRYADFLKAELFK
jgi:hypothetical protein